MPRLVSKLVFFATLAVILYASLRSDSMPPASEYQTLVQHLGAFIVLVCSARLAFAATHAFWTLLYGLILALMVELFQGLLPQGSPSVALIAANILGVLIGLALAQLSKQLLHKRQARQGW